MSLLRIGTWFAGLLFTVVLIGAAFFAWLLLTESGLVFSATRAAAYTDNALSFDSIAGSWAGGVAIEGLHYTDDQRETRVSHAEFVIDSRALISRKLHIRTFRAGTVEYVERARTAEPPGGAGAFSAPLDIAVDDFQVDQVRLVRDTEEMIDDIRGRVSLSGDELTIQTFSARTRDVSLELDGNVYLAKPLRVAVNASWHTTISGSDLALAGSGSIKGELPYLQVVHELTAPERVLTTGQITLAAVPEFDLVNQSERFEYALGDRTIAFADTRITLTGTLDDFRLAGESQINATDLPPARVTAVTRGNLQKMTVDSLEIAPERGGARASGEITFRPELAWRFDVALEHIDPALMFADWPGDLNGDFVFSGHRTAQRIEFDLSKMGISGMLRDYPVSARGRIMRRPPATLFENLRVASGKNFVKLDGRVGERLAVRFEVDADDLGFLGAGVGGALNGSGRVAGTLEAPELETQLSGSDLRWAQYRAGQLTLTGQLAAADSPSDLTLNAQRVVIGERTIERMQANIAGGLDDHRINVDAAGEGITFVAALAGGWASGTWTGELLQSEIAQQQTGAWRQTRTAALVFAPDHAQIDGLCLEQAETNACIDGTLSKDVLAGTARISGVPLHRFVTALPEGVRVSGLAAADLALEGSLAAPSLRFSASVPVVTLAYAGEDETVETTFSDLAMNGTATTKALDLNLTVTGDKDSNLRFEGRLNDWRGKAPDVRAKLAASLPDITFLSGIIPNIGRIAGSISADLELTGDVAAPDVAGRVQLTNGRAELSRAGITLEDLEVIARPAGRNRLRIEGSARSGEGRAELAGIVTLDNATGWPLNATLRGDRFSAINLPGIDLVVSPDLALAGSVRNLTVTGTLTAPRAIVTIRELPPQAVSVSSDVVVKDDSERTAAAPKRLMTTSINVNLVLGEDVQFTGFGLETELAGKLALIYTVDRTLTVRGNVDIESGRFSAYGQELKIERGRLLFGGALDDPALDVVAVRRLEDVEVGVRMTGTGQAPEATVFSKPAMAEADILGYLVTGRRLSDISSTEGENVRQSAVALGLRRATTITDAVGRAVGLDELSLDTDEVRTGAIMAGKQLTPDLYVRYSYGLFTRVGALLMRYRLTKSLSLEARTSAEDQTMDLIYTRERR